MNTEDIKASLRDLSGTLRLASLVFLLPIPFSIYFILVDETPSHSTHPGAILAMLGRSTVQGFIDILSSIILRSAAFIVPAVLSIMLYGMLRGIPAPESSRTKHILMSVGFGWLLIPLIGSLPFLLTGTLSPIDAFFESVSGFTATGLSVLPDVGSTQRDVLFYRSLSHWVGGLAVVVVAVTVFLKKGTSAATYYFTERGDVKVKPSAKGTTAEMIKIYSVYTLACMILLYLAGMSFFDSLNHSMSAISAGGFSTHTENIGYFSDKPLVGPVIVLFMLIGGISFLIHSRIFEGNLRSLTRNIEYRYMAALLLASSVFVAAALFFRLSLPGGQIVMSSVLNSVSALTSSGYTNADLSTWPEVAQAILCILMYIGGFFGSAAGGIKILRFIVIFEVVAYYMKRLILPKTAILRLKLGETAIGEAEIIAALALSAAYLGVAVLGGLLLIGTGLTTMQAVFMTFSSMGNVGLSIIPQPTLFALPQESKIVLSLLMWAGRVEVIPALVLLASIFAKRKKVLQ